ncbi:MAG TPA: hypothetical protein VI358_09175, partial [Pseudolabrys sp.]
MLGIERAFNRNISIDMVDQACTSPSITARKGWECSFPPSLIVTSAVMPIGSHATEAFARWP